MKRGRCSRCENLPHPIQDDAGHIYLWLPSEHTFYKLVSAAWHLKLNCQSIEEGKCLSIDLHLPTAEDFLEEIEQRLTEKELQESRTLWMSGSLEPHLHDFSRVVSLRNFISLQRSAWIMDLIEEGRFTSFFQPIVYVNDTSRVFSHEALFRAMDPEGNFISPGVLFSQAQDAGLLLQLDVIARQSAIQQAKRHSLESLLFINFAPTSVYDPATCLRKTVRAIDEAGIPHDRVVFEVMESAQLTELSHLLKILRFYKEAGFLVALDDFGAGYSNLNLIHQIRPDFIKLDRHLVSNVNGDPYKALITEKLLEMAHQLEIQTVAEGIETLEELNWVRDRGATYAQGFLIARPAEAPITKAVSV